MDKVLWYLLAGTRGGKTRARVINTLRERPRNANQLAERLDLDYNTTRYHLDMLTKHNVLETSGDDYGRVYLLSDQFTHHEEKFEEILDQLESDI